MLQFARTVPDVSMVREAVSDETELALLGVLEDWVESLALADLHLCVGPSGYLDNHVEDGLRAGRASKEVSVQIRYVAIMYPAVFS